MMKVIKGKGVVKVRPKGLKILFVFLAVAVLALVAIFIGSQLLNDHSDLPKLDDYEIVSGVDYVSEEVVALVDSVEQAQQKAKKYGIELKSYAQGVAVFSTKNPEEIVKSSKKTISFNLIYKTYQAEALNPNNLDLITDNNVGLWHHKEIYTDKAWDHSTGEGAVVAVIDTGIAVDHPSFTGRISDLSYNSESDQIGKQYVVDDAGHGSHVSGIIASSVWTGGDVTASGVAPGAEIMAIKANEPGRGSFSFASLLRGINYAADNGADIINLSLGRTYYAGPDDLEYQAITNAVNSGVTIIAAAGNSKESHASYPASYPEVIAVSSTASGYRFDLEYSNYGPEIDVAAPGTGIYSVNYLSGDPIKMTGTSMASPVVAGVAALVVSQNPSYTPANVRAALTGSAQEAGMLGRDDYYGSGLVSAYASLLNPSNLLNATYNFIDSGKDPIIAKVAPGSTLIRPKVVVDDQNYQEWYKNQALTTKFDFSSPIQDNTSLYEGASQLAGGSWLKEFPDDIFRGFVMGEVGANDELGQMSLGQIEQLGSSRYRALELYEMGIKDLTGIKYFSKLEYLHLYDNDILTIDVSDNTALELLDVRMNGIESIDDVVGWQEVGLVLGETFLFDPQIVGFSQQPLSQTNEYGGQLTYLAANAIVKKGMSLQYQWYSNDSPSTSGGTPIPGATYAVLDNELWYGKIGTYYYYCEATAEKDGVVRAVVPSNVAEVTYYKQPYFVNVIYDVERGFSSLTNRAFVPSIGGDIMELINLGSYQLSQITINTTPTPSVLVEGIDYEIDESLSYDDYKYYVLKESFLQSLPIGNHRITFNMVGGAGNGTSPVLDLTVSSQRVEISGELFVANNITIAAPGSHLSPNMTDFIPYPISAPFDWQWSRSDTIDGVFTPIDTPEDSSGYLVKEDDIGYYLQVTAIGTGAYTGQVSSNKILIQEVAPTLVNIEVTNPPDKIYYVYGEAFDLTGLVVSANYNDGSSRVISRYTTEIADGDIMDNPYGGPVTFPIEVRYLENYTYKYTSFIINLKPFVPTELTSDTFIINQANNLVGKIPEKTIVKIALDGFNEKPHKNFPYISFEKSGLPLYKYDFVGTGTDIIITDWSWSDGPIQLRSYKTVTKGDVDSDSAITAGDAYDIILHSIGTKQLTGAYLEAAKINSSGEVTAGDAYDVILHSIGKKVI